MTKLVVSIRVKKRSFSYLKSLHLPTLERKKREAKSSSKMNLVHKFKSQNKYAYHRNSPSNSSSSNLTESPERNTYALSPRNIISDELLSLNRTWFSFSSSLYIFAFLSVGLQCSLRFVLEPTRVSLGTKAAKNAAFPTVLPNEDSAFCTSQTIDSVPHWSKPTNLHSKDQMMLRA